MGILLQLPVEFEALVFLLQESHAVKKRPYNSGIINR